MVRLQKLTDDCYWYHFLLLKRQLSCCCLHSDPVPWSLICHSQTHLRQPPPLHDSIPLNHRLIHLTCRTRWQQPWTNTTLLIAMYCAMLLQPGAWYVCQWHSTNSDPLVPGFSDPLNIHTVPNVCTVAWSLRNTSIGQLHNSYWYTSVQ